MSEPVIPAKITTVDFASIMQRELDANSHKGDWDAWKPTISQALEELTHHVYKIQDALLLSRGDVIEHAADVANVCMKIAESFGEVSQ